MTKPFFTKEDFHLKPVEITVAGGTGTSQFGLDFAREAAAIANRLIQDRGRVVYGRWAGVYREFGESYSDTRNAENTHRALLINIEEIEQDSAEKILKDLCDASPAFKLANDFLDIIDRAKKLLERKGGV